MTRARAWHLLTFLVATTAVVLQLVLVVQGHNVLDETNRPDLGTRLVRFVSYFTILCNVLVAASELGLAVGADRDTRGWRVLRLNAVIGIAVTGLVHWFLLRPLLELDGSDYVADKLLHVVVPLLAVIGWVAFGPRGRVRTEDLVAFLTIPVGWLVYTMVRGEIVEWYPYPFIDVNENGYPAVLVACVGVAGLMLLLFWLVVKLDAKLPGARQSIR